MRIALGVEYEGTGFSGWERQPGRRTVQTVLEAALSTVADAPVATVCAGRTDSGVHATGQVVHFDTDSPRPSRAWILGTNVGLPADVAVQWAREVDDRFHARFGALRRHYRYLILNRPVRSPVHHGRVSWCRPILAEASMADAARALVGEHDFSSFRAAGCQARHPVRTLHHLEVSRHRDWVVIDVIANAFLQHMVRNIAGVLMAIGEGRRPPGWAHEVLCARDRRVGGVTASAEGLYLTGVEYPAVHRLPALSPAPGLW